MGFLKVIQVIFKLVRILRVSIIVALDHLDEKYCSEAIFRSRISDSEFQQPKLFYSSNLATIYLELKLGRPQFQSHVM